MPDEFLENGNDFSDLDLQDETTQEDTNQQADKEKMNDSAEMISKLQSELEATKEKMAELDSFKNRILGSTEEEKAKQSEFELRQRIEEDPLYMTKIVEDKVAPKIQELEKKLEYQTALSAVEKSMNEINKTYNIDWNKNYKKILVQLDNFSEKAKREKPKEVLLAAARLAGVIQKKETPDNSYPFIESSNGNFTSAQKKSIADKYKERIIGANKTKSSNVFGL